MVVENMFHPRLVRHVRNHPPDRLPGQRYSSASLVRAMTWLRALTDEVPGPNTKVRLFQPVTFRAAVVSHIPCGGSKRPPQSLPQ